MDNSTNRAKLGYFKSSMACISCQYAIFKKPFFLLYYLKKKKTGKRGPTLSNSRCPYLSEHL